MALLDSLLGGSGSGTPQIQLPNQSAVANNYYNTLQQYGAAPQQYTASDPNLANQAFNAQYNNPYAPQAQNAAGQSGQMYGQNAGMQQQYGQGQFAAGNQAMAAGNQVYQTALDPQQALYNQTLGNVNNQVNSQQAMRGLGNSPQGAQEAGTALGNFNIDWQNQQLQRQATGAQALNAGAGTMGNMGAQGSNLMGQGAQSMQQSGAMPYQTAQGIAQNQFGAIGNSQQAMMGNLAPQQNYMSAMNGYLGQGAQFQNQANTQAMQQQAAQQAALSGLIQGGSAFAGGYMNGGGMAGGFQALGGL